MAMESKTFINVKLLKTINNSIHITQMIPPVSLKQYRLYHSNDTDVLYDV